MTPKQRETLELIACLTAERGTPPTHDEIASEQRKTKQAVRQMLGYLKDLGLVTWQDGRPRTLRLTSLGRSHISPSSTDATA